MNSAFLRRVCGFSLVALVSGCVTVQLPEASKAAAGLDADPTVVEDAPDAGRGMPLAFCAGRPTTWLGISANLDAEAPTVPVPWDPTSPTETSTHVLSVTVWPTPGLAANVDLYALKSTETGWDYHLLVGEGVDALEVGAGTLEFTTDGKLQSVTESTPFVLGDPRESTPNHIRLDLGTPIAAHGTGLDGVTAFASPFNVSILSQDGCAPALGALCPAMPSR